MTVGGVEKCRGVSHANLPTIVSLGGIMKASFAAISVLLVLAGCGKAKVPAAPGVPVPAQFIGTWAKDCAKPRVTFSPNGTMQDLRLGSDYTVKSSKFEGASLIVEYTSKGGGGTAYYTVSGSTINLDKIVGSGPNPGDAITFNEPPVPMTKCPAKA